jgi:hypothetical protein
MGPIILAWNLNHTLRQKIAKSATTPANLIKEDRKHCFESILVKTTSKQSGSLRTNENTKKNNRHDDRVQFSDSFFGLCESNP